MNYWIGWVIGAASATLYFYPKVRAWKRIAEGFERTSLQAQQIARDSNAETRRAVDALDRIINSV